MMNNDLAWLRPRSLSKRACGMVRRAAKVREVGAPGARTRIETLFLLGRKPELAPQQTLMDGINAVHAGARVPALVQDRVGMGFDHYCTWLDDRGPAQWGTECGF